jgi:hypothetical protein
MNVLAAPQTWPFGAALAVLVGLAVVEGAALLLALNPSSWIDNLLPDHGDASHDVLGWLHVGKVPFLVLLILFLAGFAVSGYVVQATVHGFTGALLPAGLAAIPAFLAGLSTLRGIGGLLARVMPMDETSAVSEQTLVGRSGIVIAGIARTGLAAQAKVRDTHGRNHYVMVEPDIDGQVFGEGASVVLVRKAGARFRCIANPHPELL